MPEPPDPHRDLAGVLHDVSNALTVLLGWVGEARAEGASAESVAYALTIIEQRARVARDLARHAIGASRVDEQREVGRIVDELHAALLVEAQRKGAKLVVRGTELTAQISGALDASQVLTNLVLNALAYTPRGGTVEVTANAEDDVCTVLVTDEGEGIVAERHASIFEGDSTREGGTGVGLRHSRALARACGGEVELLPPEAGKGASFRVLWPRLDAIPRMPPSTSRVSGLVGLRVLVVEDDAMVTQLLETALEARGADVTVAKSARELASALSESRYDAALVDLSPISEDPAGAIASLRAGSPRAAVVLVTGSVDAIPSGLGTDSGEVELVRKPFEVGELLEVVTRLVGRP